MSGETWKCQSTHSPHPTRLSLRGFAKENGRKSPDPDFQQLLVSQKELLQEKMEPPHIKTEEEELWISQEHFQGLEEFPFTPVSVKSEDDEEKPQPSLFHQRQSEGTDMGADGEDYGGAETETHSQPETEVKIEDSSGNETEDSSEADTDDSEDWRSTKAHQAGLNSVIRSAVERPMTEKKPHCCPECGRRFKRKLNLTRHKKIHTGEKPFICPVCGKTFCQKQYLKAHLISHTGEKPWSCSECGKGLKTKENLTAHMRVHTGEKPFCCPECHTQFRTQKNLLQHMSVHTEEKPFYCSECGKRYKQKSTLKHHMAQHTGEQPFSCSVCNQRFSWPAQFRLHRSVCGRSSELHQSQTHEVREAETGAEERTVK
ncbi:zinc finger protein 782-like [Cheilinus undulatus]|uniref:zinc finger protein 782-like n=1 Tax=Cheilinus undulatus TaxID=241271 RepID=UPI001BD222B5|nr:zinc finger protein 782-like [Cheilinus undulatus]